MSDLLSDDEFFGSSGGGTKLLSDDEFFGPADRSVPFGSIGRGWNRLQQAGTMLARETGILSDEEAAAAIARDEADIARYPRPPEVEAGLREISEADGWLDSAKAIITNPKAILSVIGESIPLSGGPLATAGMGAAAGSAIPGAGTTAGAAAGAGAGSFATEYSSTMLEVMRENGVDLSDEQAVRDALANEALISEARTRGVKRGIPIAVFDAISFGVAGRIASLASRGSAITRTIGKAGEVGVQSGLGAAGEAGAQIADKGKITSPGDVLLEGAAESVTGLPEIAAGVATRGREQPAAGVPEGATQADVLFGAEQAPAAPVDRPSVAEPADMPRPAPDAPEAPAVPIAPPEAPPVVERPVVAPAPPATAAQPIAAGDDIDRLDSPRLTDADRASPLPNDLIDDGKAIIEAATTGRPIEPPVATSAPTTARTVSEAEFMGAAPARVERRDVRSDVAYTSAGREVPVTYAVVEADSLVPSQTDAGTTNAAYPAELQPRDRARAVSQAQVMSIAQNINPRLLDESVRASDGAPIVAEDGVVESGNGRVMAIRRAYAESLPSAESYRSYLAERGYPVEGMARPVLVRVRQGELAAADRQAFTREANERDTLGMSSTERAMADASAMPDGILALYRGGDVDQASNRDFVRGFMRAVVATNDQAGMVDQSGAMSQEAIRRVQGALLAKAYGDSDLVASLIESTDTNIKAIGGALMDVAAGWAQMRSEAQSGAISPDVDATPRLLEAVRLVQRARTENVPLASLVGQIDIFTGAAVHPLAEAFLRLMFRNRANWTQPAGRQRLSDALAFYVGEARKTSAGVDLLGETAPQAGQIIELAAERQYGRDNPAQDAFAFGGPAGEYPGQYAGVRREEGAVEVAPGSAEPRIGDPPREGSRSESRPADQVEQQSREPRYSVRDDGRGDVPIVQVPVRFDGVDFPAERRRAQLWARANIRGEYRNADTGWNVEVATSGIKKATSGVRIAADLDVLQAIPELLRSAVYVDSAPGNRDNIVAAHRVAGLVSREGQLRRVFLTILEDRDGHRFYDQHSTDEGPAGLAEGRPALRSGTDQQAQTGPTVNVAALLSDVKDMASLSAEMAPLADALRLELDALGLADVAVRVVDAITTTANGKVQAADARYVRGLIDVALDAADPSKALRHEALHAMRDMGLFTANEWAVVERQAAAVWLRRFGIAERYAGQSREVQIEEAVAAAYADWSGSHRNEPGPLGRVFNRIRDFLVTLRNALAGLGFTSAADVFAAISSGQVGSRPRNADRAASIDDERFAIQEAPRDMGDAQREMQNWLERGQFIDRAIRLPFDLLLGGIDKDGRWKVGARLTEKLGPGGISGAGFGGVVGAGIGSVFAGPAGTAAGAVIGGTAGAYLLGGRIDPKGRMGWLSGVAENARAGLIDRYGLSDEYISADRQRAADRRKRLQQANDIMLVLRDADVGPSEAKVLQQILTGGKVADRDMIMMARPIRRAIDDMGAEAVSLGLISAESFERNRGTYLHRVYTKHEIDADTLAGWVSQNMTARRQRIIGDGMKGRGLFWDVPVDRLLRNTDAARTMRDLDRKIGKSEGKVDNLADRRAVVVAEIATLERELGAQMGRRMDTAERATTKKMVGDQRTTKPSSYQKGQVREQGASLDRLRARLEQKQAELQRLDGRTSEAQQQIDATSDNLVTQSENLAVDAGDKFVVLDKVSDDAVTRRVYLRAGEDRPQEFTGPEWRDRGTWEVRKVGKNEVTLWRDYTKAERQQMGEIVDARYTIAKTFMSMANDLSTGKFFKDIADHPDWSRDEKPETEWREASDYRRYWNDRSVEWVKVPDTTIPGTDGKPRWGALAGKFVRSEIWRDLNELEIANRPGVWRKLLTQWKLNKTARSPVVHMNNVLSNVMFMDLADVRAQDLVRAVKAFAEKNDDYIDARDNGAFGQDMLSQDLRDNVLKPILDEIAKSEQQTAANPLLAKIGVVGTLLDGIWGKVKAFDRALTGAYQTEDEIFRLAMYLRRRDLGDSAEFAANSAREQFLNYDVRAPWVNAARNSVFPFISYTYRAVPKLAESIAHRPWKVAKYFTIAYAANALAYMFDDGEDGEDRERASLRHEEQGWTWIGVPRMVRMPFRNEDGLPVFLDVRRWIPAGDVFDTAQGQSAVPIPAPLQFGGPLLLAFEFLLNRQAFTGEDITNELTDTATDKVNKVGDWLWKSWMPSAVWVPNSWYWTKVENALRDATDARGRPYGLPEALASSIGVKLKPQDVESGIYWHMQDFKRVQQALRTEMRRLGRQRERNLISESEFEAGMADLVDKLGRLGDRVGEFGDRAQPKATAGR